MVELLLKYNADPKLATTKARPQPSSPEKKVTKKSPLCCKPLFFGRVNFFREQEDPT